MPRLGVFLIGVRQGVAEMATGRIGMGLQDGDASHDAQPLKTLGSGRFSHVQTPPFYGTYGIMELMELHLALFGIAGYRQQCRAG